MTMGSARRVMISFALPIFLSQLFQQLYNTADSLIVGNLPGRRALAAVSSTWTLRNLMTSLMFGVALFNFFKSDGARGFEHIRVRHGLFH